MRSGSTQGTEAIGMIPSARVVGTGQHALGLGMDNLGQSYRATICWSDSGPGGPTKLVRPWESGNRIFFLN